MILSPMQFIANIDVDEDDLIRECKELSDARWQWPNKYLNYPSINKLMQIVEKAEKDRWDQKTVDVTVRIITPEYHEHWKKEQGAHFDCNIGRIFHSYIVASAPTTIQYLGEISHLDQPQLSNNTGEQYFQEHDDLLVASILPMKMYCMDGRTLHSIPWGGFVSSRPRFFFRAIVNLEGGVRV